MTTFGTLLRAARNRGFDQKEGKRLTQERFGELIGQRLGHSGYSAAMVSHWERGKSQINKDDRQLLVSLINVLHECGGVPTFQEANKLLQAGNYRALDTEEAPFFTFEAPSHSSTISDRSPNGCPKPLSSWAHKRYRQFVGRDSLINELCELLQAPENGPMVAIDGMGGIGKTALAQEVSERCLKTGHFDLLVWESASRNEGVHDSYAESGLTFERFLDAMGRQLGISEMATFKLEEKKKRVQKALKKQRVLMVLDNLETATTPQHELAQQLRSLLVPGSKALLTSRHRFMGDFCVLHLTGLEEADALQLIRQMAHEKRIEHVEKASYQDLLPIFKTTGGSPLALRLVVGLLAYLPRDVVLEHLQKVQPINKKINQDQCIGFYKSIFWPAWQLLTDESKELLISMGHFVPSIGGSFDAICATSGLDKKVVVHSTDELWRLSLLEIGDVPNLRDIHYYLHSLTHHFVLAELMEWSFGNEDIKYKTR